MKVSMIKHIKDNVYECSCGLHFKKIGNISRCKKCIALNNQFMVATDLDARLQKQDIEDFIKQIEKFCENKEKGCLTN